MLISELYKKDNIKYCCAVLITIDFMAVLKRQSGARSVLAGKVASIFVTAALLVSCATGMKNTKTTSVAKPPVKAQTDPSAEEMEKKAHLEKARKWLRIETELLRRKNAEGVLTEYDRNDSKTLDTLEYCKWVLVSYGYILPKKEQKDGAPEYDALFLHAAVLLDGCVEREEKKFGKRELGIEDIIKLLP